MKDQKTLTPINPAEHIAEVSLFNNKYDNQPKRWRGKLTDLIAKHSVQLEKDGWLFSPALYDEDGARQNNNVKAIALLVFDYDDITDADFDQLRKKLSNMSYCIYTTFRHVTGMHPKTGEFSHRVC